MSVNPMVAVAYARRKVHTVVMGTPRSRLTRTCDHPRSWVPPPRRRVPLNYRSERCNGVRRCGVCPSIAAP